MIVNLRTYRVRPHKMPQELDLYAKHGLAPQVRHLGPPLAYQHNSLMVPASFAPIKG
jgi:hypothetical protein